MIRKAFAFSSVSAGPVSVSGLRVSDTVVSAMDSDGNDKSAKFAKFVAADDTLLQLISDAATSFVVLIERHVTF